MTINCPSCKASRDIPPGATLVACACGMRFRPDLVPVAPRAGARSDRAAFVAEREIATLQAHGAAKINPRPTEPFAPAV